jgi:hypothetical protein
MVKDHGPKFVSRIEERVERITNAQTLSDVNTNPR